MIDAKINATDIPTELGLLTEMTHFELWSALADGGTIPTEFGTCENLKVLHIEGTAIVGPIPTEMGYLTNLDRLVLQTQGLTGSVPSEIGLLTSLEWYVRIGER
jgi:Leucine-rich repeat (LRR) protein